MSIGLDELNNQLKVLRDDQRKTNEKMFQILGAIKVVEYFIDEIKSRKESLNGDAK